MNPKEKQMNRSEQAKNIILHLVNLGFSQRDIAWECECLESHISRIKSGKHEVNAGTLLRMQLGEMRLMKQWEKEKKSADKRK